MGSPCGNLTRFDHVCVDRPSAHLCDFVSQRRGALSERIRGHRGGYLKDKNFVYGIGIKAARGFAASGGFFF
jgi:hypothetical protein